MNTDNIEYNIDSIISNATRWKNLAAEQEDFISAYRFKKIEDGLRNYQERSDSDDPSTQNSSVGVKMIEEERFHQIKNIGYTPEIDAINNKNSELINAAIFLLTEDKHHFPITDYWHPDLKEKWLNEPNIERYRMAGAFIAAHLDMLDYKSKNNVV